MILDLLSFGAAWLLLIFVFLVVILVEGERRGARLEREETEAWERLARRSANPDLWWRDRP